MEDNTRVKLGSVYLNFWNTPGHTPESISIILTLVDKKSLEDSHLSVCKPQAIFSGDTIFIGDVGRPDLAATEDGTLTSEKLSEMMYDSVQRLKELPDEVLLFPGHGAGSACGKNISNALFCTMGKQKLNNYAFLENDKEAFVKKLTEDLPQPPDYFKFNVELNKNKFLKGSKEIIAKSANPLSPKEFKEMIDTKKYSILDCRTKAEFEEYHVPGSLFSPLNAKFAIFAANIIARPKKPILLICPKDKQEECILRLLRTGIDAVEGYLNDIEEYKNEGYEVIGVDHITSDELIVDYLNDKPQLKIVDVRNIGEWKAGHIDNALMISLPTIKDEIENHIKDKKTKFAVHCKSGLRSLVCWAFLKSEGYENVKNIKGGYDDLLNKEFRFLKNQIE